MTNAFTNDTRSDVGEVAVTSTPLHSYAAPSLGSGSPYTHPGEGWASPTTEDPQRSQRLPGVDFRPHPERPPQDFYERRNGREVLLRHTVEDQDADGFTTTVNLKRAAPNPRSVPTAEPRPMQRMSPRTYTFLRPFDVGSARLLNGMHFSMAEHRRTYPILGMQPVRTARNTFRITPTPWDADIVDIPPDAEPTVVPGRIQAVDIPPSGNRGWRLS